MSLWWDVCNGVISLISQSSVKPAAVWAACYNKKHLEPVWHTPTCHLSHTHTHTHTYIHTRSFEHSQGAVGWSCEMGRISHFVRRCMRLLSGGRRATGGIWERERGEREETRAQIEKVEKGRHGGDKWTWAKTKTKWEKMQFARHKTKTVEVAVTDHLAPETPNLTVTFHICITYITRAHTHTQGSTLGSGCVNANLSMCCVLSFLPG